MGVEKEENEGMEMDFAARAEEKRDSTEEMMEETNLSFVGMVPLVLAKEGVAEGETEDEEEEEDSVNEAEEVDEDSIDELGEGEAEEEDEESAAELELETKELVGVAEELDEAELL